MPTRHKKTEDAYRSRARQLEEAAERVAGHKLSAVEVAKAIVARGDELAAASFRQMRAALCFTWNEQADKLSTSAPAYTAAITLLRQPLVRSCARQEELRTSQKKQKGLSDSDLHRICHASLTRPRGQHIAPLLIAHLHAATLTGARFSEWPTAQFARSKTPGYAYDLVLVNGKSGNGRTHGRTRTLRWEFLPERLVSFLKSWIATAAQANKEGNYNKLHESLERLMREVSKQLFPRRKKHPTLSSTRHAATARWKQIYVAGAKTNEEKQHGLAIVAALLGHGTDDTATKHYARAHGGKSKFPVPAPDPAEVARIHKRYCIPHIDKELNSPSP